MCLLLVAGCSMVQCVAVCRMCESVSSQFICLRLIYRVAVSCLVLQCVEVCCSVLQCVALFCSVLKSAAVCCSVLHVTKMSRLAIACAAAPLRRALEGTSHARAHTHAQ